MCATSAAGAGAADAEPERVELVVPVVGGQSRGAHPISSDAGAAWWTGGGSVQGARLLQRIPAARPDRWRVDGPLRLLPGVPRSTRTRDKGSAYQSILARLRTWFALEHVPPAVERPGPWAVRRWRVGRPQSGCARCGSDRRAVRAAQSSRARPVGRQVVLGYCCECGYTYPPDRCHMELLKGLG